MSSIKLKHSSGNSMSIAAPATNPASDLTLKLPATVGSAHQLIRNSGTAGTLEFTHNHFFEVKLSGDQGSYDGSSTTTLVNFNAENYDVGSNFNTSTYLFTVPETGLYHFLASTYNNDSNGRQHWLVVNGSRLEYSDWGQGPENQQLMCSSHMVYLTAGNTVGLHLHTADTSCTVYANQWHTWFKGYKVH